MPSYTMTASPSPKSVGTGRGLQSLQQFADFLLYLTFHIDPARRTFRHGEKISGAYMKGIRNAD